MSRSALMIAGMVVILAEGCGPQSIAAWNRIRLDPPLNGMCGNAELAVLIPDCPLPGVCFTEACSAHNVCYTDCATSKEECDARFYKDMFAACGYAFGLDDPEEVACRKVALIYWLAVVLYGQEAYDWEQSFHGCDAPRPTERPGACCRQGTPPVCDDTGTLADCPAEAVFIAGFDCQDVMETFGACPAVANGTCAERTQVCVGQSPEEDLGTCTSIADPESPPLTCRVSSQDCPVGEVCLPLGRTAYRCHVGFDNRLVLTDGPQAGGACSESGANSFQADVWFEYVPACTGDLRIRMCDSSKFDSMLAVYAAEVAGTCPVDNSSLVACDDDACDIAGSALSALTVNGVVEGAAYIIRVGGWSADGTAGGAARGVGELDMTLVCDPSSGRR